MNKFLKHLFDGFKLITAFVISLFIKLFINKDIYLIGERRSEAKDNGYHLFKYVRTQHSEQKFYYVIDKQAKDLKNISCYKNIVYYNSIKHYLYYLLSKKLICAHVGSCTPDTVLCWKLEGAE